MGVDGKNRMEKYQNIQEMKMEYVEEFICKDAPQIFCKMLKHAKELKFEEKPDYKRYIYEMKQLRAESGERNTLFDWEVPLDNF